ncbi:MAG: NYN domain-containing protein [Myxococcota bacterium]
MAASPSRPPSGYPPPSEDPTRSHPQKEAGPSQWLVDGYNVLHAVLLPGHLRGQTRWWDHEGRERLIQRVRRFDGIESNPKPLLGPVGPRIGRWPQVCVVFDGTEPMAEPADHHNPIDVVFAPSADAYLVSRARRADPTEAVFVVSNDRQVAGRCAHAGATIVSPRDFMARCPEDT